MTSINIDYAAETKDSIKKKLINIILTTIDRNRWTQIVAAQKLNIDQPKVSCLKNNKHTGFSLDKLLKMVAILGFDVSIGIQVQKRIDASVGAHIKAIQEINIYNES